MENPYEAPRPAAPDFRDNPAPLPVPTSAGMVHQVTVVAILTIVQGVLCTIYGLFITPFAIFMPVIMMQDKKIQEQMAQGEGPAQYMPWVMGGMYLVMGLSALIPGILQIWAGIKNLGYRRRILGIVAVCSGAVSMLTCYCAPTAIGLMIFGLIVYLNEPVKMAFDMGEKGYTKDQIITHFYTVTQPAYPTAPPTNPYTKPEGPIGKDDGPT